MSKVVLQNVSKRFGDVEAVRDTNLEIRDGEFVVLVGPSGCGKTTTLRMIAGLEETTGGHIRFDDQDVTKLPPKARDIAMVFQSYALYPHMTVAKNMAFGLKLKGMPKPDIDRAVKRAAELLNITELLGRKPRELSGGQRQRVAMGRAIVRDPRAFLFDEPLSNLDAALRAQMRVEIKKLHQTLKTTVIYVTHDQIEAMTLADRIVVMNGGEIAQIGDPMSLYLKPTSKFVAGFIGSPKMNFMPCRLVEANGGLALSLADGVQLAVPEQRQQAYRPYLDKPVELGMRAEHLTENEPSRPTSQTFEVTVDVVEPTGAEALIFFSLNGHEFAARGDPYGARRPGQPIRLTAEMDHMHLIDLETDRVVPV